MSDIRISLDGDERAPDVTALYRWLRVDLDDDRPVKIALRSEPAAPGSMGAADFIHLIVENAEAIAALASSVAQWYETLKRKPTLRLERDGKVYVFEDLSPEEIQRILSNENSEGGQDGSRQ
jgi:hypothetical protein